MRPTVISPRVIAFCSEAAPFSENRILQREVAKKYPGALWIPDLADKLLQRGIPMVTGDVALRQVRAGELVPSNILVIREDQSTEADELIHLGAKGQVLLCCESPLFAASFYRSLSLISRNFNHCVIFRGVIQDAFPLVTAHALYFPSFDMTHLNMGLPWSGRKHLVMVAGNKYWQIRRSPIRQIVARIRGLVLRIPERFSNEYAFVQLHDARLAAISYFGQRGTLDLYGSGWESLNNLPLHWQRELSTTISKMNPLPCADKLATIANYKFALCFENIEFSGYVTEKVIDCLVAGVVPIYWGAPDIGDFIPDGCFIDARRFKSLDVLDAYLERITEIEWAEIVDHGRVFLASKAGQRYSYAGFAERMEAILID